MKVYNVIIDIQDTWDPGYGGSMRKNLTGPQLLEYVTQCKCLGYMGVTCIEIDDVTFKGNGHWGWFDEDDTQVVVDYVEQLR